MQCSSYIQRKFYPLFILSALLLFQGTAESFRVHKTVLLTVSSDSSVNTVQAGINDGVILALPKNKTYIQGIELSIKIPQIVAEWENSVGWSFYNNIKPSPTVNCIDYTGTRIQEDTDVFGSSFSLNIQVPLYERNSIKESPYAILVKVIPEPVDNKLFLRLQLGMKGVPDDIGKAFFEITAKPILIDKGKLLLTVAPPANTTIQAYSAFIDGKSVNVDGKGFMLDSGVHTISLVSDFYRNEVRTVTIEQAKDTRLLITFRDIAPTMLITAPLGASIFFDENKIENSKEPFAVSQGDHQVRFVVGDYEVVKTITAVNGRSYTVSVTLDASVTEEK